MQRNERLPVTVFLKLDGVPGSHSVDLSESGALVATKERPEVGTTHEISMLWDDVTCRIQGRVARHTAEGVGIEFGEGTGRFRQALGELLAEVNTDSEKKKP